MFPATLEMNSATAVLPDTPQKLLTNLISSNSARIPLIMGVNHDEGTVQITSKIISNYNPWNIAMPAGVNISYQI